MPIFWVSPSGFPGIAVIAFGRGPDATRHRVPHQWRRIGWIDTNTVWNRKVPAVRAGGQGRTNCA
jgi:hypothetical protein